MDKLKIEKNLLENLTFIKDVSYLSEDNSLNINFDNGNFKIAFIFKNEKMVIVDKQTISESVDSKTVNKFTKKFINEFEWSKSVYLKDYFEK